MDDENWLAESLAQARREFSLLDPTKRAWFNATKPGPITSSGSPVTTAPVSTMTDGNASNTIQHTGTGDRL
jgi:hypothetical protein